MHTLLRPALTLVALATLSLGLAAPLALTALAALVFPDQATGSLLLANGKPLGSSLIGQDFTTDRYLHPRPSATPDRPYNAAASAASNLGPTSAALLATIRDRIARQGPTADAATSSASGLDPHISPANAAHQAPRIAAARNLPPAQILALIAAQTEPRELALLGEPRINVLRFNLALDALRP